MADLFEIIAWGIGFALLHEGVARKARGSNDRSTRMAIGVGALILLAGVVFWYTNAQGLRQLTETQQFPAFRADKAKEREDMESVAPHYRVELSTRLAKAAFANGDENVKVLTEDGRWIPFQPNAEDLKARVDQLKMHSEIEQRRQALVASTIAAEREFKHWLASLLIAACTGFIGGHFLRNRRMGRP